MKAPRRALTVAAGLLAAVALAACGEIKDQINPVASKAQPLSLELDGPPNAAHAGLYAAQTDGDFRRAGLDVDIHVPSNPASALALVESGRVEVAITSEPQLMLARNQGATVLGFGALAQRPLSALVTLRSRHITSLRGLRSKTVGVSPVPYERALLAAALARAHVPASSVKEVDVGADPVGALTSGRVAAAFVPGAEQLVLTLRHAHKGPRLIGTSRLGIPTYDELVFVTTETFFANHDNVLRRFVQAVGRGYAAVRGHPAVGVRALGGADTSLAPALRTAAVTASVPASFPGAGRPWGWQEQQQWNDFGRWMTDHRLIGGPRAWANASTNQLLAGQGP
jgi:putative hydroxymethylpyrimidine transport system substrate-binding protein